MASRPAEVGAGAGAGAGAGKRGPARTRRRDLGDGRAIFGGGRAGGRRRAPGTVVLEAPAWGPAASDPLLPAPRSRPARALCRAPACAPAALGRGP